MSEPTTPTSTSEPIYIDLTNMPIKPIGKKEISQLEMALIIGTLYRPEILELIRDPIERSTWMDSLAVAAAAFARYKAGIPISQIAEELGRSEVTIRSHIHGKTKAGKLVAETYEKIKKGELKLLVPFIKAPVAGPEEEVRVLREEIDKLKEQVKTYKELVESLTKERDELKNALNEKSTKLASLETELGTIKSELEKVISERDELKRALDEKTAKITSLETQIETLKSELERVVKEKEELAVKYSGLQSKLVEVKQALERAISILSEIS